MQGFRNKIMNKSSQEALIEFNPKLPKLSKNEQEVLKILVEAVKLLAPLYLQQEKDIVKIEKKEIERVGESSAAVLSPYTVVEKINGKIVATPYHIKYAEFLKPIADKLNQASKVTKNKGFSNFLKLQAKALIDGSYEQGAEVWLKMKPYIIDISIGPFEHLDDRLFLGKASYQGWVGILEKEGTDRLNNYKSIILSARRKTLMPSERVDDHDKVKAKVVDVLVFSGLMAKIKFVGVNLPMNVSFVEKYGSQITLFNQPNDIRMKEQIIPIFNKIFSKAFREGFTYEDLRRASLRYIAMHELSHSFLYYRHAAENLQDLFTCIFELAATVLGFRMAGTLLLKDRITEKQLESMIVVFVSRSYYLMSNSKQNKSLMNYALGGAILINYLLESGALKKTMGLAIPNFAKIFVSLQNLSIILEKLLSSGSRNDAEALIKKYGKFSNF